MVIDGPCAGAAANLAVAADFTIASEKAKFIQAFVGVGLAPDAGGLYLFLCTSFSVGLALDCGFGGMDCLLMVFR